MLRMSLFRLSGRNLHRHMTSNAGTERDKQDIHHLKERMFSGMFRALIEGKHSFTISSTHQFNRAAYEYLQSALPRHDMKITLNQKPGQYGMIEYLDFFFPREETQKLSVGSAHKDFDNQIALTYKQAKQKIEADFLAGRNALAPLVSKTKSLIHIHITPCAAALELIQRYAKRNNITMKEFDSMITAELAKPAPAVKPSRRRS